MRGWENPNPPEGRTPLGGRGKCGVDARDVYPPDGVLVETATETGVGSSA